MRYIHSLPACSENQLSAPHAMPDGHPAGTTRPPFLQTIQDTCSLALSLSYASFTSSPPNLKHDLVRLLLYMVSRAHIQRLEPAGHHLKSWPLCAFGYNHLQCSGQLPVPLPDLLFVHSKMGCQKGAISLLDGIICITKTLHAATKDLKGQSHVQADPSTLS
jgi:hypothetical protein